MLFCRNVQYYDGVNEIVEKFYSLKCRKLLVKKFR